MRKWTAEQIAKLNNETITQKEYYELKNNKHVDGSRYYGQTDGIKEYDIELDNLELIFIYVK